MPDPNGSPAGEAVPHGPDGAAVPHGPDGVAPPPHVPVGTAPAPAAQGLPEKRGTVAWALGFLAYFPVPFLGLILAGVVQLVVGLAQRTHGGLAAVNGVRAANWGLTQLCWPVLMAVTLGIAVLTGSPSPSGDGVRFLPAMEILVLIVLGLYFVVGLLQLVYAIVGTVQASRGHRVRLPVLPVLRAPRS